MSLVFLSIYLSLTHSLFLLIWLYYFFMDYKIDFTTSYLLVLSYYILLLYLLVLSHYILLLCLLSPMVSLPIAIYLTTEFNYILSLITLNLLMLTFDLNSKTAGFVYPNILKLFITTNFINYFSPLLTLLFFYNIYYIWDV